MSPRSASPDVAPPGPPPPAWFEQLAAVLPKAADHPFRRFEPPVDGSARHSAVLVLFGPGSGSGPDVLLTQRSAGMRAHPGQVAFPGGRIDPGDAGPQDAALREAVEETCLDPAGVRIASSGPELYLPVTSFLVTPVIAWWQRPSPVAPGNAAEVSRVVGVPLAELTDPANRFQAQHPSGFVSPGFEAAGLFVWGFTAGVLSWLISLAGLERPWDVDRRRPVPAPPEPERPAGQPAGQLAGQLTEQVDEHFDERMTQ